MNPRPYLVLRDLQVWFPKRQGILEALRGAEPDYVRAVDSIDLDIQKGEIYCLVGESGCGKTTTGKGILRLEEPTGGDVFVDAPAETLRDYEAARSRGDEAVLEKIRRRWSLSYKEKASWNWRDVWAFLLAALAAVEISVLPAAGTLLAMASINAGALWALFGFVPAGVAIGFVGTLPVVRPVRRLPTFLIVATALGVLLGRPFFMAAAGALGMGIPARALEEGLSSGATILFVFFQFVFALVAQWQTARFFQGFWEARKGTEATKIRSLRRRLQIIFQDPYESLNPKHEVYRIVAEPLIVNGITKGRSDTEVRVEKALDDAGLRPARDFMFRFPHELSGGQRQRVSIAGALVLEPDFIVADEPVSMLDVSLRTEILETLLEMRERKGLTYLFITHDLSLAWALSDRIGVMYLGKIVEEGPTREIVKHPRHPYTKALISVVPIPDPDKRRERTVLKGERADPANIPRGCRFHPRCPVAFERCGWTAHEVLEDLREIVLSQDPQSAPSLEGARADGTDILIVPEGAESWLRDLVATRSEEIRALKAVRSIEKGPDGVRAFLHDFEEPKARAVAPGVRVACHLEE